MGDVLVDEGAAPYPPLPRYRLLETAPMIRWEAQCRAGLVPAAPH